MDVLSNLGTVGIVVAIWLVLQYVMRKAGLPTWCSSSTEEKPSKNEEKS